MTHKPPGPLQKHGNGKLGDNSEYGAWKITTVPDGAKQATIKFVVAASLKEIVNTYDNVISAEFLGEGGVVLTLALAQHPEGGQLILGPQEEVKAT